MTNSRLSQAKLLLKLEQARARVAQLEQLLAQSGLTTTEPNSSTGFSTSQAIHNPSRISEQAEPHSQHWLDSGGEMAKLIGQLDWSTTPLGPMEQWPESLRLITDNMPAQIGFYDRELRYRFVNAEYLRFFGVTREEIEGHSIHEFVSEEVWARLEPWLHRALAGERVSFEDRSPNKHGSGLHSWTQETYIPKFAADGTVEGIYALIIDTTERKEAEIALRLSETRLRIATRVGHMASFEVDIATGLAVFDDNLPYLYGLESNVVAAPPQDWWQLTQAWLRPADAEQHRELLMATMRGEGDLHNELLVRNPESAQEAWLGAYATLVRDEAGRPNRVVGIMLNITARKQRERQQTYLLSLADALRPLSDAVEIQRVACRLLGETLGVDRAYYVETNEVEGYAHVKQDYLRGDSPSLAGFYSFAEYGWVVPYLQAGETVVVTDTQSSGYIPDPDRAAMAAIKIIAHISVPLTKAAKLVGALCVTEDAPRKWSALEVELVRETAERIWATIERATAESALRASEAKYRTLFDSIDEGFHISELIYNDAGQAIDYRFVEVNRVFERQTGLKDVAGKLGSEAAPDTEAHWLKAYDKVVRTGEAVRFENYNAETERWYQAYCSRVGGADSRQVAIVFDNITARKQRERQQTYLLSLADALRPLTDPVEIQLTACRTLGQYTGVSRVLFGEVIDEKEVVININYVNGVAPVVGRLNAEEFGRETIAAYKRHEKIIFSDVANDPNYSEEARRNYAAVGVAANASLGLVKGGQWVAAFGMQHATPRKWTALEIALLEETAERTWAAVERARAEAALRESEQNLWGVANIVPDLLWHSQPDGSTNWYNQRWLEYTGQTFEEAIGWGWTDAIHPADRAGLAQRYQVAVARGKPLQQEHRIRRHDGVYRWFVVNALPLKDESGRVVKMYGAATDIHEQRMVREELERLVTDRTAELEEANHLLAEERQRLKLLSARLLEIQESERRLLARELHDEIGQYLTGLKFLLETSIRQLGQVAAAPLASPLKAVNELTVRVRELSLNLRPTLLDDMGLVTALVAHIQGYTDQTNIQVDFYQEGLEERLATEVETVVYRVVQEALTNIARHANTDRVLVQLQRDGLLTVLIQDEGQGFDLRQVRASHTSTGLSAMQERVELVGGQFTIESEPGYGTTIIIEIPLVPARTGKPTTDQAVQESEEVE